MTDEYEIEWPGRTQWMGMECGAFEVRITLGYLKVLCSDYRLRYIS